MTEAGQERDEFKHKNEEFDHQRAALLNKVEDEADSRASAAPRRSAEGVGHPAHQVAGGVEKRTPELE